MGIPSAASVSLSSVSARSMRSARPAAGQSRRDRAPSFSSGVPPRTRDGDEGGGGQAPQGYFHPYEREPVRGKSERNQHQDEPHQRGDEQDKNEVLIGPCLSMSFAIRPGMM